jgi:asparagine synthase (glutamine-hydrolysing)
MCGIAGIYGAFKPNQRKTAIDKFSSCLAHRGEDGKGVYEDDKVALVHRRLAIIDLSAAGNQPMYNEDRSLVLVCNGELYNYQQLRNELLQNGHQLSSNSDCEVILHLYEEHADNPARLLEKLTGMFAFALWDTKRNRLFIARDRVGIKPLYYHHNGGNLIFSSEVQPIADSGLVDTSIDYTSLYEYLLLRSIPGPHTFYNEIKTLEAGHYMMVEHEKMSIHQYWDIPVGTRKWGSEQEVVDATEALLSEVIKDHLVADVPVGSFLSAGVDSSLITSIAAEIHPGIFTFTASFPGEPEDEGLIATQTAKTLGTTHHSYELKENFFSDFGGQLKYIDQPFAIPSALSLGCISKIALQHVKVVLSGDGGDELFGGYGRYEAPAQPAFLKYIPETLQSSTLKWGAKLTGKQSLESLRKMIEMHPGKKFLARIQSSTPETALSLINPELHGQIDTERFLRRIESLYERRRNDPDELNRTLYVDFKTTLIDEMLTKADRMPLINGVEGRVPFLDHRLVELAFSIPHTYKRQNGTGKMVLRKILAKKLGSDLAFRVKTGFNSPLQQWLEKDPKTIAFVKSQLKEAAQLPFLNHALVQQYEAAPHKFAAASVYPLVCLGSFMRMHAVPGSLLAC